MAESILVTGKKISSMELVTNVIGNEKIPTGQPDDLALTPNQIADHTIIRGDLASQEDLSQVEVSLGTQITDLTNDVTSSNNSIRGLIAAEEAARIAADNLKVDKEGSVSSVAGRVGNVVLAPSDVLVEGFGSQQEVNDELYNYKKPVIYAANLKTDGSDQLGALNAYIAEAVSKRLELILPRGEICVSDEVVIPSSLVMSGINGSTSVTPSDGGTIIKWIGANGTNKAVVRASPVPIGTTPISGQHILAARISGFSIDANGCDCGLYFRRFTNESYAGDITVINANKCNIAGVTLWFCSFGKLVASRSQDRGIAFGVPIFGETGDLAINAIDFQQLRAHTNGLAKTYNEATNIKGGCGIELSTLGCNYTLIQSESNYGIGLIESSNWKQSSYPSIYVEANCREATSERISLLNYGTHTHIDKLTVGAGDVVRNNATGNRILKIGTFYSDSLTRKLSVNSTAKIDVLHHKYGLTNELTPDEYRSNFTIDNHTVFQAFGNFKYGGEFTEQKFITSRNISYPHLVFIPTDDVVPEKSMVFTVNSTSYVINTAGAVKNKPIAVRFGGLSVGVHTLKLADAASSADCNGVIAVVYGTLADGSVSDRLSF